MDYNLYVYESLNLINPWISLTSKSRVSVVILILTGLFVCWWSSDCLVTGSCCLCVLSQSLRDSRDLDVSWSVCRTWFDILVSSQWRNLIHADVISHIHTHTLHPHVSFSLCLTHTHTSSNCCRVFWDCVTVKVCATYSCSFSRQELALCLLPRCRLHLFWLYCLTNLTLCVCVWGYTSIKWL